MKKKFLLIGLVLVLLTVLVIASIPRIRSQESVSLADLENGAFPALLAEYQIDSERYDLIPVGAAEIVTVGNVWGSARYGFLPCIYSQVDTVPENGQTHWATRLCVVSACEGSELVRRFCRWGVTNVNVFADAGEDTMLSSKADIDPGGNFDSDTGVVEIIDCPLSAVTSAVGVSFRVGTVGSAQEPNQENAARFTWDFDITMCGEVICSYRDFTVEYDYINNAS